VINAWAFLKYWGDVPGLPPKSTPMITSFVDCYMYVVLNAGLQRVHRRKGTVGAYSRHSLQIRKSMNCALHTYFRLLDSISGQTLTHLGASIPKSIMHIAFPPISTKF